MLLKPSVNIENIMKLADFIESGAHPWGYPCEDCFLGQHQKSGIGTSITYSLGIPAKQFWALCFRDLPQSVWPEDRDLTRAEAVSILRELAATGRLPTEEAS